MPRPGPSPRYAVSTPSNAFYEERDAETFVATPHTEGPWDAAFQHAGPPAALLTRQIERCAAGSGLSLARLTFDILGPIPVGPVVVHARVLRPGRQIQLVEGHLSCEDRLSMRASAWLVRAAPPDLPATRSQGAPEPGLLDEQPITEEWRCGFLEAMEWRFLHGHYAHPGPATVWVRARYPLLQGEQLSPAQRVVLSADSANGVGSELDIRNWLFVPPELTVHFVRSAEGEWICLDASTTLTPSAPGLTMATLFDGRGVVATSEQSLLVTPRPTT
jgi:hypothetical protein